MPLFDHDREPGGRVPRSKISREMAELLVDLGFDELQRIDYSVEQRLKKAFGVDGFGRSIHNDRYSGKSAHDYGLSRYHFDKHAFAMVDGLPAHWWCDVYQVSSWRAQAKREAELAAAVDAFDAPAPIKRRIVAEHQAKLRGFRAPKVVDLSGMKPLPGRKYEPEGGCGAKLKLKSAVSIAHSHESYSDDSVYLIPVVGEIGDGGACQRNLGRWCEAIRSHNGFAGSGCSYSAELVAEPDGAYVVLRQRASICD